MADKRKKAKRKRRKGRHITFRKIQVLRNVIAKKRQYYKKNHRFRQNLADFVNFCLFSFLNKSQNQIPKFLYKSYIMNIMKKFRLVFKTSTIIFLTNFRYPFNSPIFLQKSEPFFPPGHHLIFICLFYTVYYDRHRICCHLSIFCGKQTISAAFHRKFLRQIALIQ